MRVQHSRNSELEPPLVVLGLLEGGLALLEEEVGVVLAGELSNLDEEVSEVFLERRDVLVEVEQSLDSDFDLVVREMRKRRAEKVGHELLHEGDVGAGQRQRRGGRVQVDGDLVGLQQGEHVGQDGGVHRQAGSVRGVRDHAEHVLQDVCVVRLVERLRGVRLTGDVLQQLEQDAEAGVSHVSHRVLERPDDGVEDQLELRRWDGQEGGEAVVVDRLQHNEEVCAVLREFFEVLETKSTSNEQRNAKGSEP